MSGSESRAERLRRKRGRGGGRREQQEEPEPTKEPDTTDVADETEGSTAEETTEETDEDPVDPKKDWQQHAIYLEKELATKLSARHDELNARAKRELGDEIEKLKTYYPTVVELGLDHPELESELGLEK